MTINIATNVGDIPVEAEIIGSLAIHRTLFTLRGLFMEDPYRYTVTHVATGLSVTHFSTEPQARRLAVRLQELADWSFADISGFHARKAELAQARKQAIAEITASPPFGEAP